METLTSSQDAESISATTAVASYEKSWYNGFNQMVGTKVDGVEATYSYAPSGLRLSKTIDGTTIDYALDGDFVAAELNGDTVTARYNRGLELVGSTIGDTTSYYLYNAHGDVVNLTNTSGAATKSYEYDAFGNEVNPAADDTNPFRYCGEYFDAETGRIYLRARYYDPVFGRMLAEDPYWAQKAPIADRNDTIVLLQVSNLYVYCIGNPIRHIDQSGLYTLAIGVNVSGQFILGGGGSVQIVMDSTHDIGILLSRSLLFGTPSIGFSGNAVLSNASTIKDLSSDSPSVDFGASWGILTGGASTDGSIHSISIGGSMGTDLIIAEVHAGLTKSTLIELPDGLKQQLRDYVINYLRSQNDAIKDKLREFGFGDVL